MSTEFIISETYKSRKDKNRDLKVADAIQSYFDKNMAKLIDGTVNNIPKITLKDRVAIYQHYNITDADWNNIKRSKEFFNIKELADILKLGLITSYLETKNRLYLVYFFILLYTKFIAKYYPRGGFDSDVMKLALGSFDARSDFKKYDNSLMVVVQKKVNTYIDKFKKDLAKPKQSDTDYRKYLQSAENRMNDSVKVIKNRYTEYFNSDEIKIMKQYSRTPDGKVMLAVANVIEAIREQAVGSLNSPSNEVMNMIGLSTSNNSKFNYMIAVKNIIGINSNEMQTVSNMTIDEWMKRNPKNLTLKDFKNGFIRNMYTARNINSIKKIIEKVADDYIKQNTLPDTKSNLKSTELREYIYSYILGNIYFQTCKIIK